MQNTTLVNPDILRTPWCDTNAHATPCRARAAALGIGATALVTTLLFLIPGRAAIAPIIEADNAYIFLAADRLYEGQGLTTIPPRAPLQAWTWRSDWVFLTQWPVGYPLLLCGMHALLGVPTAQAAQMLAVVCCGIALVAWFVWVRSCLPRGVLATLIALVAAGATFSMQNLVNPASDTVLLALVPVVLLLFRWALPCGSPLNDGSEQKNATSSLGKLALVGFVAGLLFWVRYAAIFVPIALGSFLLMRAIRKRGRGVRDLFAFSIAGLIPIAGLVILNRTFGPNVSTQEQLNLGSGISWHVSTDVFAMAWKNFAQQTPYAYRPEASAFYLWILPLIAITIQSAFL